MSTNILQHVKQLLHNRDVFSFFHNKTGNLNYLDNTTQKPEVFVSPNSTIVSAPTLDSFQALMEKGNFTTLQLAKVGIRMFFSYSVSKTYLNGLDFINICLIHNYFPGFFYISTILLASIGIFLKALFTSNPFRSLYSRYKNLEKWWRSNNYNGEEEFNEIALSLCLLLTSNDYKIFKKSDNLKSVDEVAAFSNSYVVSGHLNQLQSTPEDLLSRKEMTTDSQLPGFARTYLGLLN
ncbi:BEM_collapsed_G0048700.mRNA.1.CDS.1 [Saccharomyces cerevisiae]|nr:BEM_collapsed_G0048700.mRNA.1.CDS.1 [Saccharomyces cerevisiae]